MDNPMTGEVTIYLGGGQCKLMFDWRAIAAIQSKGDDWLQNTLLGKDMPALAELLEIGLARHNPFWNVKAIEEASPPIVYVVKAIEKALVYAYHGKEYADAQHLDDEEPSENPPKPRKTLLSKLFARR